MALPGALACSESR